MDRGGVGNVATTGGNTSSSGGQHVVTNFLSISWHDSSRIPLINPHNVMDYFSDRSNPFYDSTCNNEVLKMQHAPLDRLQKMVGVEYSLLHVQDPILYVVRKQHRVSPTQVLCLADYYIIAGIVYQAPDVGSVLSSRLLSTINHLHAAFESTRSFAKFHPSTGYVWDNSQGNVPDRNFKSGPPHLSLGRPMGGGSTLRKDNVKVATPTPHTPSSNDILTSHIISRAENNSSDNITTTAQHGSEADPQATKPSRAERKEQRRLARLARRKLRDQNLQDDASGHSNEKDSTQSSTLFQSRRVDIILRLLSEQFPMYIPPPPPGITPQTVNQESGGVKVEQQDSGLSKDRVKQEIPDNATSMSAGI